MTNVSYKNISKKRRRYFSDLYTTLLDAPWTYCVIMFSTSFYGSWLFFGEFVYPILERTKVVLLLLCVSDSGYPAWILKKLV